MSSSSEVPENGRRDFRLCKLGDFVRVRQGYTFTPKYQGVTQGKWPYAKVSDMERFGSPKWLRFTKNYVSDDVLKEINANPFPTGTVVFPRVGAALRTNKKRILPRPSLVDDNLMTVVITNPTTCFAEFLYYWFESINIEQFANDGALPSINSKNLLNGRINLPPLEEQREIAAILSTWDETIEQQTRLIELKRERKRGLMQQLLTGRVRFKEFEGLEWDTGKLGKLCVIKTGKKDVNEGNPKGPYPFFTCAKEHTYSDKYSYDMEAILIAGNGAVGTSHYYQGKFEAYQRTYILSGFASNISPKFLLNWIRFSLGQMIVAFKQESAMPYIKLPMLTSFDVPLPTLPEQQKIAAVLSAADTELETLTAQLAALKTQKRGLMQQLLTGKTRVTVA